MTDTSKKHQIIVYVILFIVVIILGFLALRDVQREDLYESRIKYVIKNYLHDNPEDIIHSLENYRVEMQKRAKMDSNDIIAKNLDAIVNNPADPFLGNKDGKIVIVEFYDALCGYCKAAQPVLAKIVDKNSDVKVILKEYPILHENSVSAAKVSLAVFKLAPSKYAEFHNLILTSRHEQSEKAYIQIAKEVTGLTEKEIQVLLGLMKSGNMLMKIDV